MMQLTFHPARGTEDRNTRDWWHAATVSHAYRSFACGTSAQHFLMPASSHKFSTRQLHSQMSQVLGYVQVLCDIAGCLITCLTCKLILEQASGILLVTG